MVEAMLPLRPFLPSTRMRRGIKARRKTTTALVPEKTFRGEGRQRLRRGHVVQGSVIMLLLLLRCPPGGKRHGRPEGHAQGPGIVLLFQEPPGTPIWPVIM